MGLDAGNNEHSFNCQGSLSKVESSTSEQVESPLPTWTSNTYAASSPCTAMFQSLRSVLPLFKLGLQQKPTWRRRQGPPGSLRQAGARWAVAAPGRRHLRPLRYMVHAMQQQRHDVLVAVVAVVLHLSGGGAGRCGQRSKPPGWPIKARWVRPALGPGRAGSDAAAVAVHIPLGGQGLCKARLLHGRHLLWSLVSSADRQCALTPSIRRCTGESISGDWIPSNLVMAHLVVS